MYPQGTASSQMVLRGMDLLLECIASGVYVPCHRCFWSPLRRLGREFVHALFLPHLGVQKETQVALREGFANHSHLHPILPISLVMRKGDGWASYTCVRISCDFR